MKSPWESFAQAKEAFDKIIPYQTTRDELQGLHFSPTKNPNIEVVTYLDLINRFMPSSSFKKEDLPAGIQNCIAHNNKCSGYELRINRIQTERFGNTFLDLFNVKRKLHRISRKFIALIVMKNNHVVYKIWSGKPRINEFSYNKNPLGPLQESESLVTPVDPSLF
ncbi:MAG: hypothetical protein Q7U88_01415 [Desulfocapsaceae bacterium]|nr:hypothetical protein [Desulfocapsaceae bacterium]